MQKSADPDQMIPYWDKLGDRISSATSDALCKVSESEDRLSLELTACPTGGVFRRGGVKGYDYPALAGPWDTLKGKHSWTMDESGFAPYCVHCGVLNDIFKEQGALIEFKYGKNPTDQCLQLRHTQETTNGLREETLTA